jgi:murein hydrolase activator
MLHLKNKILLFILCILFSHFANAQQTKEELTKQKQQIQKEIDDLNRNLQSIQNNKSKVLALNKLINQKIEKRNDLINSINKDIKRLDENVYAKEIEIYRLKKELDTLKRKYEKSITFAYKNRSNYQYLNFLFSATDFNDALKRVTFLKSYRQLRETESENIKKTQLLLKNNVSVLNQNKLEQKDVLASQSEQLLVLEQDKKEKDAAVNQLKGQENEVYNQLKKRERQRVELNNAINAAIKREIIEAEKREKERLAKLKAIEDERRKKLEAAAKAAKAEALAARIAADKAKAEADAKNKADAKAKADADAKAKKAEEEAKRAEQKSITYNSGTTILPNTTTVKPTNRVYDIFEGTAEGLKYSLDFEKNKGNLPWPVNTGYVCGKFGIQQISKTFSEQHQGIIICLPVGTQVNCVANGVVSYVYNLDEYKSVMVRHGKYITVYNKLSEVFVKSGQAVSAGTPIGKATHGDSGDGEIEFRVVQGKSNFVNPEYWLKKR